MLKNIKIKKITVLITLIFLIIGFCIFLVNADGSGKLSVTPAVGRQGETVNVDLNIENNPGLITMKFTVFWDEGLELINISDSGLLNGWSQPNPTISSPYTLRWADSLATANNVSNGKIATLTFKINDNATVGRKSVNIVFLESWNVNGGKNSFSGATANIIVYCKNHNFGEYTKINDNQYKRVCLSCGYEEIKTRKYPMGQTLVFEDGIWKYVSDGELAPEYTGLVKYYGTWYYVENGILNWDYTGLTNYYGTWYYVEGGILNWDYTGLTNYYGTWYYVEGGILNWGYTGLTNFYGTWYYVDGGILNWGYTGLTNYYGTWYYVANGVLDWNYTGSTYYYGTWYYVQGGVLR